MYNIYNEFQKSVNILDQYKQPRRCSPIVLLSVLMYEQVPLDSSVCSKRSSSLIQVIDNFFVFIKSVDI